MAESTPTFRKFREAVAHIPSPRNQCLVKAMYLTAARVSEIVTKTSPWDLMHNQTKPYGTYLKWGFHDFEQEKVLLVTLAVAKRTQKKKTPTKGKANLV